MHLMLMLRDAFAVGHVQILAAVKCRGNAQPSAMQAPCYACVSCAVYITAGHMQATSPETPPLSTALLDRT